MIIATALVSPASVGSIKLNVTDPLGAPVIDPGFLSNQFDMAVLLQALKYALDFLKTDTWKDYIIAPMLGLADANTDDLLMEYIANNSVSVCHPAGTAAMSKKNAQTGVVDADLLVKNVTGLRVVDASVFVSAICNECMESLNNVFCIAIRHVCTHDGTSVRCS